MTALEPSKIVGVVGAGAMGAGIAQVAASAGHQVLLYDAQEGASEKGKLGVAKLLERQVEKGRISADIRASILARIQIAPKIDSLAPSSLVVEAIVENIGVKQGLFAELETLVSTDTILATNTSSLSITAIAAGLSRPDRVAGMHFFNPAPLMPLVEVVAGLATSAAVIEALVDTSVSWGKRPVRARSTPGFIVNRVARPFYAEALRLAEEGAANPATIDAILRESAGFRMGPFELMDMIGHDVNFAVTSSVFQAYFQDPRYRPSLLQRELVAAGWLGRKTGRGFFDYTSGAENPEPADVEPGSPPVAVTIKGDLGPADSLAVALRASSMAVNRTDGPGLIEIEGASLALTDGRTATERTAMGGPANLVLFDLALDYSGCERVALAAADQAPPSALAAAAGLFRALNKAVSPVDDVPGLIGMRTIAMLVNEAAEAVLQGVATASDIDRAMIDGVNYPYGPLAWGERVGLGYILTALEAIHRATGDDRYRPSVLLRRRAMTGARLT